VRLISSLVKSIHKLKEISMPKIPSFDNYLDQQIDEHMKEEKEEEEKEEKEEEEEEEEEEDGVMKYWQETDWT